MLPLVYTFLFPNFFIKGLLDLLLYFNGVEGHTCTKNMEHENFLKGCFYVLDTQ